MFLRFLVAGILTSVAFLIPRGLQALFADASLADFQEVGLAWRMPF